MLLCQLGASFTIQDKYFLIPVTTKSKIAIAFDTRTKAFCKRFTNLFKTVKPNGLVSLKLVPLHGCQ